MKTIILAIGKRGRSLESNEPIDVIWEDLTSRSINRVSIGLDKDGSPSIEALAKIRDIFNKKTIVTWEDDGDKNDPVGLLVPLIELAGFPDLKRLSYFRIPIRIFLSSKCGRFNLSFSEASLYCKNMWAASEFESELEYRFEVLDRLLGWSLKEFCDNDIDRLVSEYKESSRDIDLSGLFRFSGCCPICTFGVHSGMRMIDIPTAYYEKLAVDDGFPADVREIARQAVLGIFPVWRR